MIKIWERFIYIYIIYIYIYIYIYQRSNNSKDCTRSYNSIKEVHIVHGYTVTVSVLKYPIQKKSWLNQLSAGVETAKIVQIIQ